MVENKSGQRKEKRIPERQCLGCNQHRPKREMLRVVRGPDGNVSLDFTGKKSGRGAYVCPARKCLQKARKSRRLENNLGSSIPEQVYDEMESELQAYEDRGAKDERTE